MANPGGVGTKFVSVNLNKSYGKPSHHHHPPYSGSYGQAAATRLHPGNHGGGGGGMVVLSRTRNLQKAAPKLSVPSPLNLPSLRKEHEIFDLSGSAGGSTGGAGLGGGSRPTSSGMSWSKPGTVALKDKDGGGDDTQVVDGVDQSVNAIDGLIRGISSYMPPAARVSGAGLTVSASARAYPSQVEKVAVLRGEDFPSLQSALPTTSGPQKQKDSSHQKQKPILDVDSPTELDSYHLGSLNNTRPRGQSSHHAVGNGLKQKGDEGHELGGSRVADQARKQEEYFPGPLPLVRLNPRSDWADDERDTGHGFADRGRDHGFPKKKAYWDREFDMPRSSVLPHKPAHNQLERWGQHDHETGKVFSGEVLKLDPHRTNVGTTSGEGRKGNTWTAFPHPKDGFNGQEVLNDRNGIGPRTFGIIRDTGKDNKYISPPFGDNSPDGNVTANQDSAFRRQQWNHRAESVSSQGFERNTHDQYGSGQYSRYRVDAFQNSTLAKSSFSSGGKVLPVNDPILNFGREKHALSKSDRPYVEDPFVNDLGSTGFDERDPFSGALVGVIKRKKEVVKQADFHDPVRESFEAELERVQKMQEMERLQIIEEQERALEQARKEEEERHRLIMEEEERRKRLVEEAREAAWRTEQECQEAIRRAEELKIAREEEKRRILMEEERRKQAAKLKLLELESRIAKRQTAKGDNSTVHVADEKVSSIVKEKGISRAADLDNWEDGERMVDRITASVSADSSILNRPFEMGSRTHPSREGSSSILDRGKPINSWRRDVFENGNGSSFFVQDQENGNYSPRRDASTGGRAFPRKVFYGGSGYVSSRTDFKGGMQEPQSDELAHLKEHRWNPSGDGDPYNRTREINSEFQENLAERYGDVGWGLDGSHGNLRSPYSERFYPHSESDEIYPIGRSRYSMRQPRVLPPPSLVPKHNNSFRGENERPGPSTFLDNDLHHNHVARSESTVQGEYYGVNQEKLELSDLVHVVPTSAMSGEQKLDKDTTPRCDSQSSLSVSSPPSSPPHLSHDELDESEDSPVMSTAAEGKMIPLSGNESFVLNEKSGNDSMMITSGSISAGEDEEWPLENNEDLQEQEEYDEDEDGYQEEDEVHEGYDENTDLTQEFEDLHLKEKVAPHMMDNLVLGFDEGVEVGISCNDFERHSRNEESTFQMPEVPVGIKEEQRSVDGMQGDGQSLQPLGGSPQIYINGSARMVQETEKAVQNSIIKPAPHTATSSDLAVGFGASSSSGVSSQHTIPSPVDVPSQSSSEHTVSTVSSVPNQADLPVKLQFGLFSGPSLIPSPVPAIQIGSIQMPLHLHLPVGHSLAHIQPSQPPLFQFGQLKYTSPISQGIVPMAPQSVSCVQPNVQAQYNLNQNSGGSLPIQSAQDASAQNVMKDDVPSLSVNNQPGVVLRPRDLSHDNVSRGLNSFSVVESHALIHKNRAEISVSGANKDMLEPVVRTEDKRPHDTVVKIYIPSSNERLPEGELLNNPASSQSVSTEKVVSGSKAQASLPGNKGRKFAYSVRNSGSRSSFQASEASCAVPGGFQRRPHRFIQRTEFRIREKVEKRQLSGLVFPDNSGLNDKSNSNGRGGVGIFTRRESKRDTMYNKLLKQIVESESSSLPPISSQEIGSGNRSENVIGKEGSIKRQSTSVSRDGNIKRNISEKEDDAPLQSGIVCVFRQPGIEAPSDEDDFIEVRSKRQMLNDRREQREKEIKAKSRVSKTPRKPSSNTQSVMVSTSSNSTSASVAGDASKHTRSDFVVYEGRGLANRDTSAGFNTVVYKQLSPIDTPDVNTDAQADRRFHTIKSLQSDPVSAISGGGKDTGTGLIFDTKNNKALDSVSTSLGSWGNALISQQTQLAEAMIPARFDTHVASIGSNTSSVGETILPSSSIMTKDKSFSSSASPINSLLAGEKIQFGAVTSPTVLPPSNHAVSHGIGAPGSSRSDIQISHNLSAAGSNCTLFYERDKCSNDSCVHLEDCEAEAAASAVAVAAISSDEIVGNGLGSVSISDIKSFGDASIDGITGDVASDQQLTNQSRAEESLSVSLPADLSVETPPISLWQSLPSPQNSSNHMLSHFPGGPASHFPFYEMNPMLGSPIFAFGPHEESAGSQSLSQKSIAPGSGPLGTWQQCHSTMDSFYGPSAGFTGPFISPPGGIPGVQGSPHMVVYNHFAPVGQFGQVGLSFMGTTYIPSGKQPDWKHNPTSSAMGIGDGNMNNMNMAFAQCSPPNMPAPIQPLAPGSPLMTMASPLAMFDLSPFQSNPDISVQGGWSHIPASALHTVPLSLPQQQQAECVLPSQFTYGHAVGQSLTSNRFMGSQTSAPSDNSRSFPVAPDAAVTQFPGELGLVESSSSTSVGVSTQSAVIQSSTDSFIADASKTDAVQNDSSNNTKGQSNSAFKTRSSQQKNLSSQQYSQGYTYQRGGGMSQRNTSGSEWSHHRTGFHGRNQSMGAEKGFPSSKMKQVYVAKQTMRGSSTAE